MRCIAVVASLLASLIVGAPPAFAADVQRSDFRYTRQLVPAGTGGPVVFEPDGPLFAHSSRGFADLRVLDARGGEVAWRLAPRSHGSAPQRVGILNRGRQGGYAVALLDLEATRGVHDRVALDIPDQGFIGRAAVLGADHRRGPFTRLSVTGIYDVQGAEPARSTIAVFPPSDFRYLMLRVSGVSRIDGASVSGTSERPRLIQRHPRTVSRRERGTHSIVTLDFGFPNLPIDELRIKSNAPRYERPLTVLGSNDGRRFGPLAAARIFRFAGSSSAPIVVDAGDRYLRIEVENGDDVPLPGIEVSAWSRSRALLVDAAGSRPYTLYYGSPAEGAPIYDFARLPVHALGLEHAVRGLLGAQRLNPVYEPAPDTRSFVAKHRGIVTVALALAALALGAVGLVALRKRA